jgi:hypothetical protein
MSFNHPKAGPNSVPAYQMSGIPFVTSSVSNTEVPSSAGGASIKPLKIQFPYVTKFITLRNTGISELRLAFSYTGSYAPGETMPQNEVLDFHAGDRSTGRHYFLIPTGSLSGDRNASIQTFDVRCKEVYLLGNGGTTGYSLLAGLTTIFASQFPMLTGSIDGITGFEGVG